MKRFVMPVFATFLLLFVLTAMGTAADLKQLEKKNTKYIKFENPK